MLAIHSFFFSLCSTSRSRVSNFLFFLPEEYPRLFSHSLHLNSHFSIQRWTATGIQDFSLQLYSFRNLFSNQQQKLRTFCTTAAELRHESGHEHGSRTVDTMANEFITSKHRNLTSYVEIQASLLRKKISLTLLFFRSFTVEPLRPVDCPLKTRSRIASRRESKIFS